MVKTENINFRISKEQKEAIEKLGEGNLSQAVSSAVDFFLAFPPGFMAQIQKVAEMVKLPISVVIVHLLQNYTALDAAILETFHTSTTYQRAFRYDPKKGLIEGDELSEILFKEYCETAKELRRKLEETKKTGKPARVAGEEIRMIAGLM